MMSFKYTRIVLSFFTFIYVILLGFTLPNITFNNDYWLPKQNPFQKQLDYLESEFQPGFGATVVLDFHESYFKDDHIELLRSFVGSIEDLEYVFKVNSPLDATVITNVDGKI